LQKQNDMTAESEKVCFASLTEGTACQARVRALEAAAATYVSDFDVERERLLSNASLEQAAKIQCQAQLQGGKDAAAESEKLLSARSTEGTACQAQVRELEAVAATHAADFETEREQLQKNASIEKAAVETLCEAQLQEQQDVAAESDKLLSASLSERAGCQAQVKELEAATGTHISDFEVEREQLQKNASLEKAATESRCQAQLQEQQDVAAEREENCSALQTQLQRQEDAASKRVLELEAERAELHDMAKNCSELQSHLQAQLHEREESGANASAEMTAAHKTLSVAAAQDIQALSTRLEAKSKELEETLHLLLAAENTSNAERTASQNCSSHSQMQLQMLEDLHSTLFRSMTNASLEQAAMKTQFQAQLQEAKDAAHNEASNCPAKLEESGTDFSKVCSDWANAGKCESSPEIMHTVCKTSCKSGNFDKTLGTGWKLDPSMSTGCCCDLNEFCSEWAEQGMCESNAKLMLVKCRYSCGACAKK